MLKGSHLILQSKSYSHPSPSFFSSDTLLVWWVTAQVSALHHLGSAVHLSAPNIGSCTSHCMCCPLVYNHQKTRTSCHILDIPQHQCVAYSSYSVKFPTWCRDNGDNSRRTDLEGWSGKHRKLLEIKCQPWVYWVIKRQFSILIKCLGFQNWKTISLAECGVFKWVKETNSTDSFIATEDSIPGFLVDSPNWILYTLCLLYAYLSMTKFHP